MREVNREPAIADCDPEVYEKGVSVCLVSIPKETAEVICQNITAATGCKVDWHYFGGHVHIKALRAASQSAPVVPEGLIKAVEFYEQVKSENPPVETGAWKDAVDWVLKEACRAAMLNQK